MRATRVAVADLFLTKQTENNPRAIIIERSIIIILLLHGTSDSPVISVLASLLI